jgi:hypothetical protein
LASGLSKRGTKTTSETMMARFQSTGVIAGTENSS